MKLTIILNVLVVATVSVAAIRQGRRSPNDSPGRYPVIEEDIVGPEKRSQDSTGRYPVIEEDIVGPEPEKRDDSTGRYPVIEEDIVGPEVM